MEMLLDFLENESETAIKWFKQNGIIVNVDKFQAMVLGRYKQKEKLIWILMEQKQKFKTEKKLGVELGNEVNFDNPYIKYLQKGWK